MDHRSQLPLHTHGYRDEAFARRTSVVATLVSQFTGGGAGEGRGTPDGLFDHLHYRQTHNCNDVKV